MNTVLKIADRGKQRKCGPIKETHPPRNTEMKEGAGIICDDVLGETGKVKKRRSINVRSIRRRIMS